jgi:hypothetical protein
MHPGVGVPGTHGQIRDVSSDGRRLHEALAERMVSRVIRLSNRKRAERCFPNIRRYPHHSKNCTLGEKPPRSGEYKPVGPRGGKVDALSVTIDGNEGHMPRTTGSHGFGPVRLRSDRSGRQHVDVDARCFTGRITTGFSSALAGAKRR